MPVSGCRNERVHTDKRSSAGNPDIRPADRAWDFGYTSQVMQWLVNDYARRKRARWRGAEFEITLIGSEELAGGGVDAGELA